MKITSLILKWYAILRIDYIEGMKAYVTLLLYNTEWFFCLCFSNLQ